ncbi:hypothetical protein [Flavobacterium ginsenosidimutans]|nr:hypothetical protein [Flavobacterium ginsenosidimutans]KAF2338035.1 hypothetical protein DM444_01260 [Flavobacterium ginsenosidimutans]
MRVILTLAQLKKILKTEKLKFPISYKGTNFTSEELSELSQLLVSKSHS